MEGGLRRLTRDGPAWRRDFLDDVFVIEILKLEECVWSDSHDAGLANASEAADGADGASC